MPTPRAPKNSPWPRNFIPVLAGLPLALFAAGCHQAQPPAAPSAGQAQAAAPTAAPAGKTVRIATYTLGTLEFAQKAGVADKRLASIGWSAQWIKFPAGPQALEALNAGAVDYVYTGDAPPIFAQAAGTPLVYVGTEPANPQNEAILVAKGSPIKTLADLKGKKIALNRASDVHYLLLRALQSAGLKFSDVQIEFLPPADARAAFESGQVDSWVIWSPWIVTEQKAVGARVLADGTHLAANPGFYESRRDFAAQHPDVLKILLEETQHTDDWQRAHPHELAAQFSEKLKIPADDIEQSLRATHYGVGIFNAQNRKDQQDIADTFHAAGLLPKPLNVQEAELTPDQAQAIAPANAAKVAKR